jgi:hypothetical protein
VVNLKNSFQFEKKKQSNSNPGKGSAVVYPKLCSLDIETQKVDGSIPDGLPETVKTLSSSSPVKRQNKLERSTLASFSSLGPIL